MSKIEQIISEIEEYIDSCKFQPLSNTKIVVNKDEIEELLSELRLRTPEEIKKYQKIINNKDAILNDARQKADALVSQAAAQAEQMISEHEISQQAYAQANDMMQQASNEAQGILDKAVADADALRTAAVTYTDDELVNLCRLMTNTMERVSAKYDAFMKELSESLEIVQANRKQLVPQEEEMIPAEEQQQTQEDYNTSIEEELTEFEDYTVNLDDEF